MLSLLLLLILDGEEILKAVSRVLNVSEKDRVALIVIKKHRRCNKLKEGKVSSIEQRLSFAFDGAVEGVEGAGSHL